MNVARNVMLDPRLVPGGGAAEMALAHVSTSTEYILFIHFPYLYHAMLTCALMCAPLHSIPHLNFPAEMLFISK